MFGTSYYSFDYEWQGRQFSFTIFADSEEEALGRFESMKSAQYGGELIEVVNTISE